MCINTQAFYSSRLLLDLYTLDELRIKWMTPPVIINRSSLFLPQFKLDDITTSECIENHLLGKWAHRSFPPPFFFFV